MSRISLLVFPGEPGRVSSVDLPLLPDIEVTLDDLVYMPDVQAPPDRPHPFAYFLTIHNHSDQAVTIRGRKWVVAQRGGDCLVIEGDGVVGETPTISPGDSFSYNSAHVVAADSLVDGAYLGVLEDGQVGIVRIPQFELHVP